MINNIGYINYINSIAADKQREAEIRRSYGYTDQDHVTIFTLPKGQRGKKYNSFSYKTLSPKAKRLQDNVYTLRGRINKVENSDLPEKEKIKKINGLRCQLKYANCKLSAELASMPRTGVIVLEEGE